MKKVASSNIAGLDLMKLFASLLVVGIHSELILALNTKFHTQVFMIAARMAVPVFFISSSFLLARHIAAHHNQIAAVKHYVRRVSQLYLFWLVLYGYFIIRATIVNIQVNGWHWTNFIYGLLGCLLSGPKTMLLCWYLNASLFGVLFVYYWFRQRQALGVSLAVAIFAVIVIFSAYLPLHSPLNIQASIFVGPLYFYLGKLSYRWYAQHRFIPYRFLVPLICSAFGLAWIEIHGILAFKGNNDQLFSYPLLAEFCFLFFLQLPLQWQHTRWLRNLTSFMYLSHYLLMKIFYNFLYFQIHSIAQRYVIIIVLVILSYLLVIWLQHFSWGKILHNAY